MTNRVFLENGKKVFKIAASILMMLLFLCGCSFVLPAVTQPTESAHASPSSESAAPALPTDTPKASQTPELSPSQSPEKTPADTPLNTAEKTPEESPVPEEIDELKFVPDADSGFYDEFFDSAVFVGDSISQGLQNYVLYERGHDRPVLGNARFLAIAKYSLKTGASAFDPAKTNLTYQGVAMPLEDCLFMMDAQEVYIMLGLNDWAGSDVPGNIEKFRIIIGKVSERNPDIKVYIQLCTPITENGEKPQINNANIDKFNLHLRALAKELKIEAIDVSSPLKDKNNFLPAHLSKDDYVHLTNDGLRIWVDTLHQFARDKYIAGEWEPAADPEEFTGIIMNSREIAAYIEVLKTKRDAGLEDFITPDENGSENSGEISNEKKDETKNLPVSFK